MTTEKNRAFAAALEELYLRYPLPEYKYRAVRQKNEGYRYTALNMAARLPHGDLFVIEMFAVKVPHDILRSVHTLIFG
jgi:hypothetical protein